MRDEKWIREELKELIKRCKNNAKENRHQAKDCQYSEPNRAEWLQGGAEAMDHAAKEVQRILNGKTSMEALEELLQKVQQKKAKV